MQRFFLLAACAALLLVGCGDAKDKAKDAVDKGADKAKEVIDK